MATAIFDFVSEELEARCDLEKLEARGTVRLALKSSGLDAQSVSREQMVVVLEQVLPGELESRGVTDAPTLCAALVASLNEAGVDTGGSDEPSPEDVFRRLASR